MVMAWRVRGGELPLSQTLVDPKLHHGQISTTQTPFLRRNAHSKTLYNAWSLLLEAQSSCVVLLVVLGLVRCLRWKMGTKLGRSQPHVRPVGRFSRARTVGTHLLSRLDAAETPHLPCLVGQVWFPGATHRAIKRCPKVWRQSWRTARILNRFGAIRWVNSLGIKWERQYLPLWAPACPASPCCISSGFADASGHAAISGCVETRVECTVSHGFGKSGGNGTVRTFPVHLGTQFAQVGHLGVESVPVISGFFLNHQRLYKANLASIVQCHMVLMWPCLVDPVEKARLLHISQGFNLV